VAAHEARRGDASPAEGPTSLDALVACFGLSPLRTRHRAAHRRGRTRSHHRRPVRCGMRGSRAGPSHLLPGPRGARRAALERADPRRTPAAVADRRARRRDPAHRLPAPPRRAHPALPGRLALPGPPVARNAAPQRRTGLPPRLVRPGGEPCRGRLGGRGPGSAAA
ncbi:LOW QUALITY PROTEIN: ATPase central domain-containing protein, partial [Streptomyces pristinaespiralis ATCC 25486]